MTRNAVVTLIAICTFALCSMASHALSEIHSNREMNLTRNVDSSVLKSIKEVKVELVDKVRDGCWPRPKSTKEEVELRLKNAGFKFSDEAVVRVLVKGMGYRHGKTCIVSLSLDVRYVHTIPLPSSKMSGPLKSFDRHLGTVSIAESDMLVSGPDLQDTITTVFFGLITIFNME